MASLTEGLPAGSSAVGAIAGMGAHVYCQADGRRESVATGYAGVGAVAGMGVEVSRQVVGSHEHHAAGGAIRVALPPKPPRLLLLAPA